MNTSNSQKIDQVSSVPQNEQGKDTKSWTPTHRNNETLSPQDTHRYGILDSIDSEIVVLDSDLAIIYANQRWLNSATLNEDDDEIESHSYFSVLQNTKQIYPEQMVDVERFIQQLLTTTINEFDVCYLIHSGQTLNRLKIHATSTRFNGNVQLVICHDVTSEHYVANHDKTDIIHLMVSGVSHSFKDLLASIQSNSELLQHEVRTNIRANNILMRIFNSINSATHLTEQFLLYSQTADSPVEEGEIDKIIAQVLESTQATLPSTIEIVKKIDEQTGMLNTDSLQLSQLLMHLFENAIYAIEGKPGCILISLQQGPTNMSEQDMSDQDMSAQDMEEQDMNGQHLNYAASINPSTRSKMVHLRFEDSGSGMAEETLHHCFEPFYTTKPFGYSAGLGLSMVRRIVMNLGGRIVVTSKVGVGTTFDIYFPATTTHLAKAAGTL